MTKPEIEQMNHPNVLRRAVDIVGTQTALAKACGVKQQHVWKWLHRCPRVPAEHVLAIEKATNGAVSRHDLRPDIYPRAESLA